MAGNAEPVTAHDDHKLKKHIGPIGLLFTAVGSIIGSGWLFGAMYAAEMAGPAAILSWIIAAIMILLIGLTYAELGTMFPLSGGVIRYPHFAYGSFASYTLGWITFVSVAAVAPVEVEAALQYANNYVPWLQRLEEGTAVLTTPGFFVACAMMFLFCLINMLGIRWFARINNLLVWWKLGVIVLVVVVLMFAGFDVEHVYHPKHGGFLPLGWHGVFSSIATAGIVFSYFGFRQGVELAGETDNPQRNVPMAILLSIGICAVIYVLLQVAFIGVLPESALANGWEHIGTTFSAGTDHQLLAFGPLAALATTLGLTWLAVLLYIDAFISPADTGLIYNTITSRMSYAMARNANAPRALARVNANGVPWISVILSFFVSVVFFLPFPGWQKLIGFVTSSTVLSFGSGPLVLIALRKELPDYARPFRLRAGWLVSYFAFFSSNLIVFWSGWDVNWKLMLAVVLGLVLLAIHETGWGRHTPRLDLKAGFWVIPWLTGLTLISYLGRYPDLSANAGNLGVLGIAASVTALALFSAFIMWLAYHFRLRSTRVIEHLNEPWVEDPS